MKYEDSDFSSRLRTIKYDLEYINTTIMQPIQQLQKHAKREHFKWKTLTVIKHTFGITCGICAVYNAHQEKNWSAILGASGMLAWAKTGFLASEKAQSYQQAILELKNIHNNISEIIKTATADEIHLIANTLRNNTK